MTFQGRFLVFSRTNREIVSSWAVDCRWKGERGLFPVLIECDLGRGGRERVGGGGGVLSNFKLLESTNKREKIEAKTHIAGATWWALSPLCSTEGWTLTLTFLRSTLQTFFAVLLNRQLSFIIWLFFARFWTCVFLALPTASATRPTCKSVFRHDINVVCGFYRLSYDLKHITLENLVVSRHALFSSCMCKIKLTLYETTHQRPWVLA